MRRDLASVGVHAGQPVGGRVDRLLLALPVTLDALALVVLFGLEAGHVVLERGEEQGRPGQKIRGELDGMGDAGLGAVALLGHALGQRGEGEPRGLRVRIGREDDRALGHPEVNHRWNARRRTPVVSAPIRQK